MFTLLFSCYECLIDAASCAEPSSECLAAVRLLLLAADAAAADGDDSTDNVSSVLASSGGTGSAGVVRTCSVLCQSLLPLADVLQSAGSHVYLSTNKLHRAMMMMTALINQLNIGYYYWQY